MPNTSTDFDFDDWAGLCLENPAEFEARRQATLLIEMLRLSPENAASARRALDSFEQAADGCPPAQRLTLAASMMQASLQELGTELQMLQQSLFTLSEAIDPAVDPDGSSAVAEEPLPGLIPPR